MTALHAAAANGYLETAKALLEGGAELDPKNADHKTPKVLMNLLCF